MLSFEKPLEIDEMTIFRDHADPDQFWYLSGPVQLGQRPGTNRKAFSFIKYKPAVAGAGVKGGGFTMFETTLDLSDSEKNHILGAVMAEPGVHQPRLSPVVFETGTVQAIALDLQGGGGTTAEAPPPGAFRVTQKILGATTPTMDAENRAAFSLTLSQEGATILEQALTDGLAPIGVLYTFTYSGMRPALEVEITADLKMIYNHFSASLSAQYQWVRAGIDAAFEKLRQDGAIKIKILNFTGEEDEKTQEQWALAFFKDDLLQKWFEPTFTPGQLATPAAKADPLAEVAKFTREALRGEKPADGGATTVGNTSDNSSSGTHGATTSGATHGTTTSGATTGGGTHSTTSSGTAAVSATHSATSTTTPAQPQTQRQPARLTQTSVNPNPLPAGHAVTHTPSASGNTETITVTGAGAVVRVGGQTKTLDAQHQFTVDVAPEGSVPIEVDWPAAGVDQTFHLYFDFDEPWEEPWHTQPPTPKYRAYVTGTTADSRFNHASGIAQGEGATWPNAAQRGVDRLLAWLGTLQDPKIVEVDTHASFETQPQPGSHATILTGDARTAHNMQLSRNRADVAAALISRGNTSLRMLPLAQGDQEASADPNNPPTGDPNDRVARITGKVAGGQAMSYRGTLTRPRSTVVTPPSQPHQPTQPHQPSQPSQPQHPSNPTSTPSTMPGVVSLQLKFVRQDERKTMKFYYNRAEATRRTYAPQGFFGLMLADIADREGYFSEIDLDDPFFREFTISATAPIDFARIGLTSAEIAVDYGDPADAQNHKHHDFAFGADDNGPKTFTVFLNASHDIDYAVQQQFHFSPDSDWDAEQFTIEVPAERTTDRMLIVNPHKYLDFLEIDVTPGDIDAGVVERIEVTLQAAGPGSFSRTKVFMVTPGADPQMWKLRAPKPGEGESRSLTVALKHFLKDGTTRETPAAPVEASAVIVHDPFDQALDIVFVPLFDAAATREVFVDVAYDDPDNSYHRQEQIVVKGGQTEDVRMHLALLNPHLREFRFRFSFVGTNGDFNRTAWQTTSEAIQPIRP